MSFPAHGPSRHLGDALDRRDDALYRTRRMMIVLAGGAVTASVALGVVFASELPGHAAAQPAGSPAGTAGSQGQAGAGSAPASQSGAAQPQGGAASAPTAPAPAPPQVVSGGS